MFDSTRRGFLKGTAGTAATLVAAGLAASPKAYADDDEIVIASIFDQSGGLDIYGTPMTQTCELAVEEINAAGGLLGKKVRLIKYDPQSNMELYAQYAQEAALKERVDLVHGAITSASREVIRPILRRFQTLLWYSVIYEGGVCDINNFVSGVTAVQWVKPMADYGFRTHGKRCYYIGADYNAPQIIGKWTEVFSKDHGAEVLTKDFFPLDVAEFGPAIAKIQEAKPDWLSTCLVGAAHTGFYRQWYAAGMLNEIPIVSTTFGVGNEHKQLSAEEGNGIVSAQPYFQELQLPANVEFVQALSGTLRRRRPVSQLGGCRRLSRHHALVARRQGGRQPRARGGDRGAAQRRHRVGRPRPGTWWSIRSPTTSSRTCTWPSARTSPGTSSRASPSSIRAT